MIEPTVPESKLYPSEDASEGRDEWVDMIFEDLCGDVSSMLRALEWDGGETGSVALNGVLAVFHHGYETGGDMSKDYVSESLSVRLNDIHIAYIEAVLWPQFLKKIANGDFLGE